MFTRWSSSNNKDNKASEFTFTIRIDHLEEVPGFFQPKVAILLRINNTIVGKTEFRVVTTNTGYIKYNQTFEFQCTLTKGKTVFEPKYVSFDVLVKKGSKIETASKNNRLNLADFASLNRQVAEKEAITVTVHEGMNVPLHVAICSVPSVIGRRGKSLDYGSRPARIDSNNNNNSNTTPPKVVSNPLATYHPDEAIPRSNSFSKNLNVEAAQSTPTSTTARTSSGDIFPTEDLLDISSPLSAPTPYSKAPTSPTSATSPSPFSFEHIARRRTQSSATGTGSNNNIIPPSKNIQLNEPLSSDVNVLQKQNRELMSEVEALRAAVQRLQMENASLKEQLSHAANPFDDYVHEEDQLESHLHTADRIDAVEDFF